ncbi:MAG: hypothetical protein V1777_04945 [Candidatus Micrarchaeota archaeon]
MITAKTKLRLKQDEFDVFYHKIKTGKCVSFSFGDLKNKIPVVRIHSACLFSEAFGSRHCDCREQLEQTLKLIKKNKSGVIVYSFDEGRDQGMENKIKAMELERQHKIDSAAAYEKLNLKADTRTFDAGAEALHDLNVNKKIKLVSANPAKIARLEKAGFEITERPKLKIKITRYNKPEFELKKKLGYLL